MTHPLTTSRTADPASAGIDRFVGLEHIERENLHIRSWGLVADGTTFTSTFKRGQAHFGKRLANDGNLSIPLYVRGKIIIKGSSLYVADSLKEAVKTWMESSKHLNNMVNNLLRELQG